MTTEHSSIHDFDFQLICAYFASIEQQGPGSPEATRKALSFIAPLTATSQVADLGCGTGTPTRVLAAHSPGRFTGVDLFPQFIDKFNQKAHEAGLQDRVKGITGNMEALPFAPESLDLIWSEGAIYNIGFERGLREWRKFLKHGGYVAISEASWFTNQRPSEIEAFWLDAYPGIDTIPNKVAQLQEAGYLPIASFILPESCWTDYFYKPQKTAREIFLNKHAGNKAAEELVANERREEQLYHKYKDFYGYVFYIGKKI